MGIILLAVVLGDLTAWEVDTRTAVVLLKTEILLEPELLQPISACKCMQIID